MPRIPTAVVTLPTVTADQITSPTAGTAGIGAIGEGIDKLIDVGVEIFEFREQRKAAGRMQLFNEKSAEMNSALNDLSIDIENSTDPFGANEDFQNRARGIVESFASSVNDPQVEGAIRSRGLQEYESRRIGVNRKAMAGMRAMEFGLIGQVAPNYQAAAMDATTDEARVVQAGFFRNAVNGMSTLTEAEKQDAISKFEKSLDLALITQGARENPVGLLNDLGDRTKFTSIDEPFREQSITRVENQILAGKNRAVQEQIADLTIGVSRSGSIDDVFAMRDRIRELSPVLPPQQRANLTQQLDTKEKAIGVVHDGRVKFSRVQTGNSHWDPSNPVNIEITNDAWDNVIEPAFDNPTDRQGNRTDRDGNLYPPFTLGERTQSLLQVVSSGGIIPESAFGKMIGMLEDPDPNVVAEAANRFDLLLEAVPRLSERVGVEQKVALSHLILANINNLGMSVERAVGTARLDVFGENTKQLQDKRNERQLEYERMELSEGAEDRVAEQLERGRFDALVIGVLRLAEGELSFPRPEVPQFVADEYRRGWHSVFLQTGSIEAANNALDQGIKNAWGITSIGGSDRFMRNTPEMLLDADENGHEWVQEQLLVDLDEIKTLLPFEGLSLEGAIQELAASPFAGLSPTQSRNKAILDRVVLQSDFRTTRGGQDGTLSWRIAFLSQDEDVSGLPVIVPLFHDDGTVARFTPDLELQNLRRNKRLEERQDKAIEFRAFSVERSQRTPESQLLAEEFITRHMDTSVSVPGTGRGGSTGLVIP